MPFHELTDAPAALAGLMADVAYFAQNPSVHVVRLEPSAAPPADRHAAGRTLWPGQGAWFELGAGESLHGWTLSEGVKASIYVSDKWLLPSP